MQLGVIEAEYSWRDGGFTPYPIRPHSSLAADSVGTAGTGGMGDLGRRMLNALTGSTQVEAGGVGDRTGRVDRPLGVLSETATQAFPDIFGAVTESDIAGPHHHREPLGPHKPRHLVDAEVSRVMADFWVAFATYGDPNGQPERRSGAGDMGGYAAGTRPDQAPWWPRLLGDIPGARRHSLPVVSDSAELIEEAGEGAAEQHNSGDGMDHREDHAELGSSDPLDSLRRRMGTEHTQTQPSAAATAEGHIRAEGTVDASEQVLQTQEGYSEPVIRSTVGRDLGEGDGRDTEVLLPPPRTSTHTSARNMHHNSLDGTVNTPGIEKHHSHRLALSSQQRAGSALLQLQSRHITTARFMHHMVFDEQSSVNIIENDCICNAWDQMEYRF